MTGLFEEKKWFGEFFLPDQYEKRFPGEIEYSPENGVILSYSIMGHDFTAESDVVYGVLSTGDKCTLLGKFVPQDAGHRFKHGFITQYGKTPFLLLLVGEWMASNESVFRLVFSLTNMQEFFFPNGYRDLVRYSEKPLLSLKTPYGEIQVRNNASFGFFNTASQIYSQNKDALKELEKSFDEIRKKYSDTVFMLKKDIDYLLSITFDNGSTIQDAYRHLNDIANLFSILIHCPVYPDCIYILKSIDGKPSLRVEVFPSMVVDKKTIDIINMKRSHFYIPITNSNVDLHKILALWINYSNHFSIITSSIQNTTGFSTEHSLHGEILMYITQLESISHNNCIDNKHKYDHPINTYGSDIIKQGLSTLFARVGEAYIGKGISDLRNEIAHVGKPKKLLMALSLRDMVYISVYLQMTLIGHVLTNLGIKREIINDYQDKLSPKI